MTLYIAASLMIVIDDARLRQRTRLGLWLNTFIVQASLMIITYDHHLRSSLKIVT